MAAAAAAQAGKFLAKNPQAAMALLSVLQGSGGSGGSGGAAESGNAGFGNLAGMLGGGGSKTQIAQALAQNPQALQAAMQVIGGSGGSGGIGGIGEIGGIGGATQVRQRGVADTQFVSGVQQLSDVAAQQDALANAEEGGVVTRDGQGREYGAAKPKKKRGIGIYIVGCWFASTICIALGVFIALVVLVIVFSGS